MTEATTVTFQGAMTIRNAATTLKALGAALTGSDRVTVDCSAVEEVDLTFIQILLASCRGAALAGKTLRLASPPAGALLDILVRGGFVGGAPDERRFWGV